MATCIPRVDGLSTGPPVRGVTRSKRQSWSMQRELRVGTKLVGFAKLQEVGVFPLLGLILA